MNGVVSIPLILFERVHIQLLLFLRFLGIFPCLLSTVDQKKSETSAVCVCVCVHLWLLVTEPFSLFLLSIFFIFSTQPVYLLKLPRTDAPIASFWTNGSQCVMLSFRLLRHQLRCKRRAGWVGVLCASPPSSGPWVTPYRGRAVRLGVKGVRGAALPPPPLFSSCRIKAFQHSSEFSVMKGLQPACSIRCCTTS